MGTSEINNPIFLLKKEIKNYKKYSKEEWIPKFFEKGKLNNNEFIIREFVDGQKLEDTFLKLNIQLQKQQDLNEIKKTQNKINSLIKKIIFLFLKIKKLKIQNIDFSVENIIIEKNQNLKFIDLEYWVENNDYFRKDYIDLLKTLLNVFGLYSETWKIGDNKNYTIQQINKIKILFNLKTEFIYFLKSLFLVNNNSILNIIKLFIDKDIQIFDNSKSNVKKNKKIIIKKINSFFLTYQILF
ncbi:hypothetical protein [Mesomycoplasma neurolyticum]|uniref:Protein kinase domain-containing protein n=1 Tax=Mesomycoplasma neurolyticum TaxID=2120 RepID=A0A449A5N7_9BACT|nr:hypothetical protein [Mesomycoplasma neurolyticum]VEU59534.1 Uncharacterised protein [Mesomycoplasma neurolyticum]